MSFSASDRLVPDDGPHRLSRLMRWADTLPLFAVIDNLKRLPFRHQRNLKWEKLNGGKREMLVRVMFLEGKDAPTEAAPTERVKPR
jgi:hypothetical protein